MVRTGRLAADADVRERPDEAAPVIGQLAQGALVIVTGELDSWVEIIYGNAAGGHGWIPQSAVSFERPVRTPAAKAPTAAPSQTAAAALSSSPTQQTPAPAAKTAASQLPGRLVFQDRNGGAIYIMKANGMGLRKIASGFEPVLSPDGQQIAFTRWDEPRGLWIADSDGGNARLLFGANQARSPSWTPDGAAIVFQRTTASYQCASTPFGCLTLEQWLERFGQQCVQTPFGTICFDDFSLLTQDLTAVTRVDAGDGASRDLPASTTARAPVHSPAGDSVLFVDDDGLQVTRSEGNDRPLLLVDAPGLLAGVQASPDGQFIYGSRRSGDHWDIWRWRADGSQATALTAPPALRDRPINNVSPAVSPDGRFVAFLTDRSGKWELWIMNADGSNQRPLAPNVLAGIKFNYDFVTERMIDWGP